MTQAGILSPEGSCKTFDASADGYGRAEGINAVYIKKLSDAIRDGNPIRAVIRNTGVNSDGKSASSMAPNGESQEALMRKVYEDSGLDPFDTTYVEVIIPIFIKLHQTIAEIFSNPVSWNWNSNW